MSQRDYTPTAMNKMFLDARMREDLSKPYAYTNNVNVQKQDI